MSTRDEYIKRLKAQLDEVNTNLDKLEAQAREADAEARIRIHGEMDKLRDLRERAEEKVKELQEGSHSLWEEIRHDLEELWEDLKRAGEYYR